MTSCETWLLQASKLLIQADIPSARLDALILLEDASGKDRAWLLAHPEHKLLDSIAEILNKNIMQRSEHIPLAYIRGKTEFYGRTFCVDQHVLEPRPESETMISLLKQLPLRSQPVIADVGTGSGALAITAKLELPQTDVLAIDIDPACLSVAERNAEQLQARISLQTSDLLAGIERPLDVVLANLPYVPDDLPINQAARHEPRLAIFGGPDGLELYRKLFDQLSSQPASQRPNYILSEALPGQHQLLSGLAQQHGYTEQHRQDFVQVFCKTTN